jgi:stage III sporulation protein AA
MKSSYDIICSYMPAKIGQAMKKVSMKYSVLVNEVRLRINRPIVFVFADRIGFLSVDGRISENYNGCMCAEKCDIENIMNVLCRYSVHSCIRELSQGFFTVENGIRVGVAGTYSPEKTIKYINAFNFRIARQEKGCAENIFNKLLTTDNKNILICGGVNSGKTTILRDLCRLCGNRRKTVLIDERNEISGSVNGIPENDIGMQTDVIEGCSRADGIISALKTLSPEYIFCDEISTENDSSAIIQGYGCGISFVATIHADNYDDLLKRYVFRELLKENIFDYAVILNGKNFPGQVHEIRKL